MNIDSRVQKLEKQIKNLKKMLGGVAALALAALIGGTVLGVHAANGNFNIITAKTIYVKDSSGKTRALLDRKGVLRLYDSSGKRRVALDGTYGILRLYDSSGRRRVALDGERDGILRLYDSSGKRRVALDGKYGRLRLYDLSGKYRVALEGIKGNVKTYKSNGQVLHELGKGSNTSGPHTHPVAKHKHTATTTIR
ncbi:MAG: hypothetical protein QF919_04400 [Nitrospinota bacterium]|nr:hypothetical protein [Nitrospinota bacterium]